VAHLLLETLGMILTTVLTAVVVGVSSTLVWLAIGAD
jgi:hypothetical protein